jgi:sulfopyruvate decarboxylase subunit beta
MAKAAGVKDVRKVTNLDDLRLALNGIGVIVVKVEPGNAEVPIIDIPPEQILARFKAVMSWP